MNIFSRLFLVFLTCVAGMTSIACTTFCIQRDGKKVFGKNYDWVTGTGMIHENVSGLQKTALSIEEGNELTWTARYGSVTFNQFGKEFPNGGMNEQGLVVELMWLNGSSYPRQDQRPSLSVLQWIQFQLDNAATVEEVIKSDERIRVFSTGTPQHYLVTDRNGKVATIEFLNGKMEVHQDNSLPYPVLTNSTYASSVSSLRKKSYTGNNSLQRFNQACEMITNYHAEKIKMPLVDYAYEVLGKVSQADYTKWSIVYDIDNMVIYFKTGGQERRSLRFSQFSFDCNKPARAYDLAEKQTGDISTKFSNYSSEQNELMLKQAFRESSTQVTVPETLQDRIAALPAIFTCSNKVGSEKTKGRSQASAF